MARLKNSMGIWMAGANATRFMPDGYHVEVVEETMPERFKRIADGVGDLLDGFEGHYPGEINEDNLKDVKAAIGNKDIYAIALGTFSIPELSLGAMMNPDPKLREYARELTHKAIDIAAELGSKFIIWPGNDGYNYPNQADYSTIWKWFLEGIADAAEYCNSKGVPLLLEDKNSEPKMRILLNNQAVCILVIKKLREMGIDTTNIKVNMDWQHLIMRGENLPQWAAMLADEGMLGHQHANSGWGLTDDDNIVGASYLEQTIGICIELQLKGYGSNGERIGYDLFPYTEDQVRAAKMCIRNFDHIWSLAEKITDKNGPFYEPYMNARMKLDAMGVLEIVNHVLIGLPMEK
ncbi:MAG: TIM barrel protein [Armatimonadota bacterium]